MRVVMIDDSIPFDGLMPTTRPLGGAEKAFAGLAGGLVRAGCDVEVYNRCAHELVIEGAKWFPLDKFDPPNDCDVLLAFRKPSLLGSARGAKKHFLWVTAHPRYLVRDKAAQWLDSTDPTLIFVSDIQRNGYVGGQGSIVLQPGVRWDYLREDPMDPADPPIAVTTAHPKHGLSWLIDRWVDDIRPRVPDAELHVYSAVTVQGMLGEEIPEDLVPTVEKVLKAHDHGVRAKKPDGDLYMADDYLRARVHLYPGHPEDFGAWTLMESQALGVPGVARPLGAAPERIVDGMTGQIVPDDAAFANVAVDILTDDDVFKNFSGDCREMQRGLDWTRAAQAYLTLFGA